MAVALGEAFINVRADLKPFAKDLERDLKKILAAAEKKVASDPNTGRNLGESFRKQTSDGTEKGLEEGFRKGSKKGFKGAMSDGEKFFAGLANFVDDGLSAIPGKVKAGILIGVIAAALVVAPLLAGTISAAIVAGVSLGVVGGGIAIAASLKPVEDQFIGVGRAILDQLRGSATVFVDPLLRAGESILNFFVEIGDQVDRIFGQASLQVKPLTDALLGFVRNLLPGIETAVKKARPLIEALAEALPRLGNDIAIALNILSDGSASATVALKDFLAIVGALIIGTAGLIRTLSELWFWFRVIAAIQVGNIGEAVGLFAQREHDAALATGQLVPEVENLDTALGGAATKAYAARNAIDALIKTQLKGLDASIDYEQAIDDLSKAIVKGNTNFDVRDEKGRANLRLVEAAISGAARQRDIELERASVTGRSVDEINAAYQKEITTIEQVIGKNNAQNTSLKDVFETARSAPKDVSIPVKTPGLDDAAAGFEHLGRAIRGAIHSMIAGGLGSGGAGIQFATQHALGTITSGPEVALIGEAGKEAVIPDPAKMPGRAMQLSSDFGLTSMIANALGVGQTIVNVFIGQQKLEEIADFRISYNNQMQAMAMAQGPRGV